MSRRGPEPGHVAGRPPTAAIRFTCPASATQIRVTRPKPSWEVAMKHLQTVRTFLTAVAVAAPVVTLLGAAGSASAGDSDDAPGLAQPAAADAEADQAGGEDHPEDHDLQ